MGRRSSLPKPTVSLEQGEKKKHRLARNDGGGEVGKLASEMAARISANNFNRRPALLRATNGERVDRAKAAVLSELL